MAKIQKPRIFSSLLILFLVCLALVGVLTWIVASEFEYVPNYGNLHQPGKDPCQQEKCTHKGIDGYISYTADHTILAWMLQRDFAIRPFQRSRYSAEYFAEAEEEAHPHVVQILRQEDSSELHRALTGELDHYLRNGLIRGRSLTSAEVEFFPDHIIAMRNALLDHHRYDLYFQMGGVNPSDLERAAIDLMVVNESLAALTVGGNISGAARIWDAIGFSLSYGSARVDRDAQKA